MRLYRKLPKIAFPFDDFSTVFYSNLKIEAKTPRKTGFLYMIWPWRVVLTYAIAFYTYQSTFLSKKLNVEEKLTGRPSPTVQCKKKY